MGRKSSSTKDKKSKKPTSQRSSSDHASGTSPEPNSDGLILVDPSRIRFQFSRIRPYFSGCGRSVTSTFDSILSGDLNPNDLPPIQVLIGPVDEHDGLPWYFSLNNRRLWVFKRCAEEGLLDHQGGKIWVRVREPKSQKERERYTLDNCAVEAKFIRERDPNAPKQIERKETKGVEKEISSNEQSDEGKGSVRSDRKGGDVQKADNTVQQEAKDESSSEESSDGDEGGGYVNRFAGLDI